MQQRKLHLQKHRMRAFNATLSQLEARLIQQIKWVTEMSEVYHYPKSISRRNVRNYKRWLKATEQLKQIEQKDLS